MANVKKGNYNPPPCWWKHMKFFKRRFWKRERLAAKADIKTQTNG